MGCPDFLAKVLPSAGEDVELWQVLLGMMEQEVSVQAVGDRGTEDDGDDSDDGIVAMDAAASKRDERERKDRKRKRSQVGTSCPRRLRVGVDVSAWIHAAMGGYKYKGLAAHTTNSNGGQKNQNRSARYIQFNSENVVERFVQSCVAYVMKRIYQIQNVHPHRVQVLVVFDGATPPSKLEETERRKAAAAAAKRRSAAGRHFWRIHYHLLQALRQAQIPFLVAPYEADPQLAFLSQQDLIDLIITEDSDLIALGARSVLYKSSVTSELTEAENRYDEIVRGKLLQGISDLGCCQWLHLMDFTPVMIAAVFVAAGCDYCERLPRNGIKTAAILVREAFFCTPSTRTSALDRLISALLQSTSQELTVADQQAYRDKFVAAMFSYRHPVVFDPIRRCQTVMRRDGALSVGSPRPQETLPVAISHIDSQQERRGGAAPAPSTDPRIQGDPELTDCNDYASLCNDGERRKNITGRVETSSQEAIRLAEGGYFEDKPGWKEEARRLEELRNARQSTTPTRQVEATIAETTATATTLVPGASALPVESTEDRAMEVDEDGMASATTNQGKEHPQPEEQETQERAQTQAQQQQQPAQKASQESSLSNLTASSGCEEISSPSEPSQQEVDAPAPTAKATSPPCSQDSPDFMVLDDSQPNTQSGLANPLRRASDAHLPCGQPSDEEGAFNESQESEAGSVLDAQPHSQPKGQLENSADPSGKSQSSILDIELESAEVTGEGLSALHETADTDSREKSGLAEDGKTHDGDADDEDDDEPEDGKGEKTDDGDDTNKDGFFTQIHGDGTKEGIPNENSTDTSPQDETTQTQSQTQHAEAPPPSPDGVGSNDQVPGTGLAFASSAAKKKYTGIPPEAEIIDLCSDDDDDDGDKDNSEPDDDDNTVAPETNHPQQDESAAQGKSNPNEATATPVRRVRRDIFLSESSTSSSNRSCTQDAAAQQMASPNLLASLTPDV